MDESADLDQMYAPGVKGRSRHKRERRSREEGGEETERRAEGRTGVGGGSLSPQPQSILIGGQGGANRQTGRHACRTGGRWTRTSRYGMGDNRPLHASRHGLETSRHPKKEIRSWLRLLHNSLRLSIPLCSPSLEAYVALFTALAISQSKIGHRKLGAVLKFIFRLHASSTCPPPSPLCSPRSILYSFAPSSLNEQAQK